MRAPHLPRAPAWPGQGRPGVREPGCYVWAAAEVCCRWGLPGTSWSLSVCDPRRNSRGLTGLLFIPPHPRLVPGPTGAFRAPTPPRPGPCGARAAGHPAPGPWAGGSVPASWSPGWQRQPGGSRRRLGQGTHGGGRAGLPGSAAGHLSPPSGPRAPRPTLGCEGQGAGIRGGACIPQQQERPAPAPRGPFALRSGREISVSRKFQLVLRPQRCPGPVRLPAELLVGLCLISGKDDRFLTGNFCEVSACPLKSAFFFSLQITPGGTFKRGCGAGGRDVRLVGDLVSTPPPRVRVTESGHASLLARLGCGQTPSGRPGPACRPHGGCLALARVTLCSSGLDRALFFAVCGQL